MTVAGARGGLRRGGLRRDALLWALGAALSSLTLLRGYAPHDEGLMLAAGGRIASGQMPYRDFWTNYPPGQGLVLAGVKLLTGASLLAWRVLAVAVAATTAVLCHRLARRECPAWLALCAWLTAAGALAFPLSPGPNPPALMLALAALLAAGQRPRLAALLAGAAGAFRIEVGIAAALGIGLYGPGGSGRRVAMTAGAITVTALALTPFAGVDAGAMVNDTIGFLRVQDLQRLPFPLQYHGPLRPSKLLEFYMPVVLVAGCALWALSTVSRPRGGRGRRAPVRPLELGLLPLAVVGLTYLLGRTDEFHLAPLTVVLAALLAAAIARGARAPAVLGFVLGLALVHGVERRAGQALHPPTLAGVPGPAGAGVGTDPADAGDLKRLIGRVDALVGRGRPIFAANARNDVADAGDSLLYTILDRPNPTRYDVMQPGVTTTARVQREIVAALDRGATAVVVRWRDPRALSHVRNGAARSSGVHVLDEYLDSRYRVDARFGYYELLVRGSGRR